jgi:hypothetical protein
VEGVALTATDPDEKRKLQAYSSSLLAKQRNCQMKASELLMFAD